MVSIPPGSSLGRYQILEQIGQGGMATVFRAHDPELNRTVAIKVLPSCKSEDTTFVRRFRTEAQAIARLNHPNIVQVYDFGQDKGFSYIVMEHVTGGTLSDLLTEKVPLEEAVALIGPVAEALEYAHRQGIVHRDIKPSNVLIDDEGKPKLSDFGLARLMEGGANLTGGDAVLGTPEYMAPEQALGRKADQRSDLYALGVLIYQMLLGQTPFHADTPPETLMAHVHQPVPPPSTVDPDVDPRIEANLIKALAKDPDDRHESPTALIEALRLVSAGEGVALPYAGDPTLEQPRLPETRMSVLRRSFQTWPLAAAVVALVAVAVGVGAVVLATSGGDDGSEPPSVAVLPPTETPTPGAEPEAPRPAISVVEATSSTPGSLTPTPSSTTSPTPGATPTQSPTPSPSPSPTPMAVPTATPTPLRESPREPTAPDATPTPHPRLAQAPLGIPAEGELLTRLHAVFENMSSVSGIQPEKKLVPRLVSREELVELAVADRLSKRERLLSVQRALFAILGMIPPDLDLGQLLFDIDKEWLGQWSGWVSYYDEETGELYVLKDLEELSPFDELDIAFRYMNALLDRRFDVYSRLTETEGDLDRFLVLHGLVSGDLFQTQADYLLTHFTPVQMQAAAAEEPSDVVIETPIADGAPGVIGDWLEFGAQAGPGQVFVTLLGNRTAVNLAYEDPPASTEQVLHRDKHSAGERPVEIELPILAQALGPGWTEAFSSTMGEWLLRLYLGKLSDTGFSQAAAGWGGDRFSILHGPLGETVLALLTIWDTAEDAAEFTDFIEANGAGQENLWLGLDSDRTLLIIAPHQAVTDRIRAQFPGF